MAWDQALVSPWDWPLELAEIELGLSFGFGCVLGSNCVIDFSFVVLGFQLGFSLGVGRKIGFWFELWLSLGLELWFES